MTPKGHFEINWPLKIQSPRKNEIPILSKKKPILFWGSNKHNLNMKTSRWVFLLNFKQASQSPCCVIGSREKTKFSNWLMKDVIWKKGCPKCDFKTSQKNYLFRHIQFHNDCGLCDKVFFGKHRKSQLNVSKSQNKIMKPKLLPKTNRRICFSILTVQIYLKLAIKTSSFKYFRTIRIEK